VNVAAVAAAAAATTIPTGRRCQGVRVDVRQRQRRAGGSGSGGCSDGRAAAEAAGVRAGGRRRQRKRWAFGRAGGSGSGGRAGGRRQRDQWTWLCGDGTPYLAWGPGCELGDMPPVLGIPLRLGRPRPSTQFRPRPELAPRAKGPLLLIEIENPAINCHEFENFVFYAFSCSCASSMSQGIRRVTPVA